MGITYQPIERYMLNTVNKNSRFETIFVLSGLGKQVSQHTADSKQVLPLKTNDCGGASNTAESSIQRLPELNLYRLIKPQNQPSQ